MVRPVLRPFVLLPLALLASCGGSEESADLPDPVADAGPGADGASDIGPLADADPQPDVPPAPDAEVSTDAEEARDLLPRPDTMPPGDAGDVEERESDADAETFIDASTDGGPDAAAQEDAGGDTDAGPVDPEPLDFGSLQGGWEERSLFGRTAPRLRVADNDTVAFGFPGFAEGYEVTGITLTAEGGSLLAVAGDTGPALSLAWATTADPDQLRVCWQTADTAAELPSSVVTDFADPDTGCADASPPLLWLRARGGDEVHGAWTDPFGGQITIDGVEITVGYDGFPPSRFLVLAGWEAQWILTRNAGDNPFSPGLYSRFDFTPGEVTAWLYCQTVFDGADAAAALGAARADADDLETGCGGFPWSPISPAVDLP
jgi:hypothetical protein